MSDFPGFILTKRGQALLAKLQAGGQLTFTRVFTGSGRMPPDNNVFSAVAVGVGVTITNSEVGAAGAADVDTGFTVVIATPGSAGVAQVATVQCLAASELAGGEYFTLSSPYLLFHVWFTKDGVGSDPAPAGSIGIRVDLAAGNTAIAVAAILATTLDSHRLDLSDLCCLITARQDLAVQSVGRVDDAVSEIKVILTNAGLAVGYDLCEIGIFATDPDVGEILYAVTNAGDQGDYFPAEGGATLIEAELSLRTIIAAAAELSMVIKAEAYAGLAQFIAHTGEAATEAVKGHMQFATLAETLEGLLTSKAVHPAGVKAAIDVLINLAPEALNDLNELSAALGDDPNYATTMLTALAGKAALAGDASQVFRAALAAQFSSDSQVATTEFVKRALGNYSSHIDLSGATTLTAAALGGLMVVASAVAFTTTLPLVSQCPGGSRLEFVNQGSAIVTIARQGVDPLKYSSGADIGASFSLYPGDTVALESSGSAWGLCGGSRSLGTASGQFGSSLTTNGYQKLPSGKIEQWLTTGTIVAGGSAVVTLPTTFPNAVLSSGATAASATLSQTPISASVAHTNTSQLTIYNRSTVDDQFRVTALGC